MNHHFATFARRSAFLLFFAISSAASAQKGDFHITSWDTRTGLPEALVQALAFRPESGVWVATEGGVCLFDGSNCKPLPIDQARKLPQNNITALLVAHDRSLWAGTEGAGLLHIVDGRVESFSRAEGLGDGYVRALYEDSHGILWVGTDFGFYQKEGAAFKHIALGKSGSPQFVHAIVEDQSGDLIVGGKSLIVVKNDTVSVVRSWKESGGPRIKSLLVTREGNLLVGSVQGAFEMDHGKFRRLPLPPVDVEALCQSADGAVWIGTVSAGLWRLKHGETSRVELGEGGSSLAILAMTTDTSGRMWVGTQRGLSRIEQTSIHFLSSPAQAVDRETLSLSNDGTVHLVDGSVMKIEDHGLQRLSFPIPGNLKIIEALFSKDHSVWLGTTAMGVYRIDPKGQVRHYSAESHPQLSTDSPRGLVEGTHGDIWVATEFGVDVIQGGGVKSLSATNGLPSRAVRTLFLDSHGCMWIGTDSGPAVSCRGALVKNQATSALSEEEIWAIAEDPGGTMWFGTRRNGIYAISNSEVRHLTMANGLPTNDICGLVFDRHGTLWVSGLDSVFAIPASSDRADSGGILIPRSYVLPSSAEGLRFTRGRVLSGAIDARGTVWFASDRGIAFIDESPYPSNTAIDVPMPVIRSVVVDHSILPAINRVRTPPNPHHMVISFGSDYLGPAEDTLLMYRLKGIDEGWVIAANVHEAEYNNLPAGSYSFELKAYGRTRPDHWMVTSSLIIVPLIWYRSPLFFAALIATILGVIFGAYLMHLRKVRYKFRLILEERNRVAREMHDTFIQGCNGVVMLLEAEACRNAKSNQSTLLSEARVQLQATVSDARDALWNLRQSTVDADYLRTTLNGIAEHATTFFGVPVDLMLPKHYPALPLSRAHEMMMIVREAVTNAGTHSSGSKIEITLQATSQLMQIEVADDGCGFDVESASTLASDHFGIRGMQERAVGIGASFQITSSSDTGTVVRISLSSS